MIVVDNLKRFILQINKLIIAKNMSKCNVLIYKLIFIGLNGNQLIIPRGNLSDFQGIPKEPKIRQTQKTLIYGIDITANDLPWILHEFTIN